LEELKGLKMDLATAKLALDKIIKKSRAHLYKPIQVAEILYRDRVHGDIVLSKLESYRNPSKKWRNIISRRFVGNVSTSSQKFQDNLFEDNATPPEVLVELGKENIDKNGAVEAYVYRHLEKKFEQMILAFTYCESANPESFELEEYLNLFWQDAGLKRSIDKLYEIVVYALFSVLVDELNITVSVSIDEAKIDLLKEFEDFAEKVICISPQKPSFSTPARLFRVGVTNAAGRGVDMWANFGPAVQIKHLALDESLAQNIVESVTADRIVIVCKSSERDLILSLVNQLGWKSRIQSIITESNLIKWYDKALRGSYSHALARNLLTLLGHEISLEFPIADTTDLVNFLSVRGYDKISDEYWTISQ